ncbi:MAG: GNAT family N-acetyltransferase [Pirellulaceae bacterium]|jgi:D-alanine-D-alanine ligase|nr:GNAT family N-acetyltransferase [Pirellulaceae bacterium]
MKIAILHNAVAESDSTADRDVLIQAAAVDQALNALGHVTRRIPCTLDLEALDESLTLDRPQLVFNLVESLGGSDRLAHLAARLLDDLDLPYTGTHAAALHLANNKPAAKRRMREAGLPTPPWAAISPRATAVPNGPLAPPYIIKAIWEHASVGLDDHAVVRAGDGSTIAEQIESRARQLGVACFAEQFVEGREFNIALIAGGDTPHVLPPAEIDYSKFPAGKPHIVGYAAKWDEGAFEFEHTPRRFDFPPGDAPLLDTLRSLALECWRLFQLRGYGRVDFRIDAKGRPWILEINANPCLSPEAGFAAALARADIPFVRAVDWILEDALSGPSSLELATTEIAVSLPSSKSASGGPPRAVPAPRGPAAASKRARPAPALTGCKLRSEVVPADVAAIRQIVESTGLFRPSEIDVAGELVEARLAKGAASGYEFVLAEERGQIVGFACFGRNTLTVRSWDLYWIAVSKSHQGRGLGGRLLAEVHRRIAAAGGGRVYIETSDREDYLPTRRFYERHGYILEAMLSDFYAPGDSKAIFVREAIEQNI